MKLCANILLFSLLFPFSVQAKNILISFSEKHFTVNQVIFLSSLKEFYYNVSAVFSQTQNLHSREFFPNPRPNFAYSEHSKKESL